jgi:hypothetical protein
MSNTGGIVGRPKKEDDERKDSILTLRLKLDEFKRLDDLVKRIQAVTGLPTTRSAVAVLAIELGREALEKKYPARKR